MIQDNQQTCTNPLKLIYISSWTNRGIGRIPGSYRLATDSSRMRNGASATRPLSTENGGNVDNG